MRRLQGFFIEEFDGGVEARLLSGYSFIFMAEGLGLAVYNQAVQDARKFMQERLDDLAGDVYEPEVV